AAPRLPYTTLFRSPVAQFAVHAVELEIDMGAAARRRFYRGGDVAALGLPATRVHGRRDRRRGLDQGRECELEVPGQIAQRHPVLRPPRASEARLYGREVEREGVGIHRLRR